MLTIKKRVARIVPLFLTTASLLLFNGCTPPGPRNLLEGEKLLQEGKTEQAIQKLEEAVRLMPQEARAQNYLGIAYQRFGQTKNAIQAYQAALNLNRNLANARYNLGCLYLENNNPTAAATELATFTSLQPESLDGWKKRGVAYLRLRQIDLAKRTYAEAYRLAPKDAEVLNGVGLVHYYEKRYRDAAAFFTEAAKQNPPCPEAVLNLAVLNQLHLNNKAQALDLYHAYVTANPHAQPTMAAQEIERVLDIELNPSHAPSTNQPPQIAIKTNLPPATNAVAQTQVQTSAVASVTVVTNRSPGATTLPNNPPTNTVAVAKEPVKPTKPPTPLITAKTEAPAKTPTVTKPAPPLEPAKPPVTVTKPDTAVASANTLPRPSTVETEAPTNMVAKVETPPEHRSFFQRINPINLFRSQPKRPTPLAGTTPPVKPTIVVTPPPDEPPAQPGEFSSVTPLPKRPPILHYTYVHPAKPEIGNRAQAEPLFEQGLQAQTGNHPAEAVEAYRAAVRLDPSYYAAQFNLGLAAYGTGDLPTSLTAYETALAINPLASNARYNFALALQKGHYYGDAANELEKLLATSPSDTRAHLAVANIYAQQLFDRQRAREHYQKVLQLDSHHPQAEEIRYWLIANP